jgi:hypothetical protein
VSLEHLLLSLHLSRRKTTNKIRLEKNKKDTLVKTCRKKNQAHSLWPERRLGTCGLCREVLADGVPGHAFDHPVRLEPLYWRLPALRFQSTVPPLEISMV